MTAKKKTNKKTGKVEEMKNKEAPEIFSKLQLAILSIGVGLIVGVFVGFAVFPAGLSVEDAGVEVAVVTDVNGVSLPSSPETIRVREEIIGLGNELDDLISRREAVLREIAGIKEVILRKSKRVEKTILLLKGGPDSFFKNAKGVRYSRNAIWGLVREVGIEVACLQRQVENKRALLCALDSEMADKKVEIEDATEQLRDAALDAVPPESFN